MNNYANYIYIAINAELDAGKAIIDIYTNRSGWDMLWIVVPLDVTKEFIMKNGVFTVNIALVKEGVPVLGVIYVPVRKELYFAADSLGAFKLAEIDYGYQPSMDEIKTKAIRLPMPMAHK